MEAQHPESTGKLFREFFENLQGEGWKPFRDCTICCFLPFPYNKTSLAMWAQQRIRLPAFQRGYHLITRQVCEGIDELSQVRIGLLHLFIQHTSASLTINENADPDVRTDMETAINHIVPESLPYVHTIEGPDDMPAHMKASLMGPALSIPVRDGELQLGTWQGIYLCEHRNRGGSRSLVATLQGEAVG